MFPGFSVYPQDTPPSSLVVGLDPLQWLSSPGALSTETLALVPPRLLTLQAVGPA